MITVALWRVNRDAAAVRGGRTEEILRRKHELRRSIAGGRQVRSRFVLDPFDFLELVRASLSVR
jgi:hypothetical protein